MVTALWGEDAEEKCLKVFKTVTSSKEFVRSPAENTGDTAWTNKT